MAHSLALYVYSLWYGSVNIMSHWVEDGPTQGILIQNKLVSESSPMGIVGYQNPLRSVHTYFCYKIQCQNCTGSLLLNEAMSDSQVCRTVFVWISRVIHPSLPHGIIMSGAVGSYIYTWYSNYMPCYYQGLDIFSWKEEYIFVKNIVDPKCSCFILKGWNLGRVGCSSFYPKFYYHPWLYIGMYIIYNALSTTYNPSACIGWHTIT